MKTTLTELEGSRVRMRVEVASNELEGRLERKAGQLGRELKLPGFRRGKVPPSLVIQRMGREAILEEAVREVLPRWYSDAVAESGIVPVGDPKLELDGLPSEGEPLAFSVEVGVLPRAQLGEYVGLEVPRREPEVQEARIDAELEALRERLARLESVQRAAAEGDFVVVDYTGFSMDGEGSEPSPIEGAEGRDQLLELGAGKLIPGFEEGLVGAAAGEERRLELSFPDDYPNEAIAGAAATFEVAVKDVKLKQLPELDDDLAIDAGFDSLADLREDIRGALMEVEEREVDAEFRAAALDAAVEAARVEVTPELTRARAGEMWERMLHSLAHRGISREAYLQVSGRDESQILAELEPEAEKALRREAVLGAIVEAEGISPTDEQLLEAIGPSAAEEGVEPQELLQKLRSAGRIGEVREDLAVRQAVDVIAAGARAISVEKAQARERLWTPEQAQREREQSSPTTAPAGRLWTPGDPGPAS